MENKQKKDANGVYQDSDETRLVNSIQKVFHADNKKTVNEYREGKEAIFMDEWLKKYQGQTRDKTTKKGGGKAVRPEPSTGAGGRASTSLFNK